MKGKLSIYSTYGWHPLGVAAALGTLRYLKRHEKSLLRNVFETGEYFRDRLTRMRFRSERKVRVVGLAVCVEFEAEKYAQKIGKRCLERGLLLSAEGDALLLLPSLNIERADAEQGLNILEQSL